MADRTVHYEAAFEAFLRERGIPCVAVDEAKKALFSNAKLKSFDFVVYSKKGPNLLLQKVEESKAGKNRVHWDWMAASKEEHQAEIERLIRKRVRTILQQQHDQRSGDRRQRRKRHVHAPVRRTGRRKIQTHLHQVNSAGGDCASDLGG